MRIEYQDREWIRRREQAREWGPAGSRKYGNPAMLGIFTEETREKTYRTVRVMERTLAEGRPVLVLTQYSDSDDVVKESFPEAQVLNLVEDLYGFLTEGVLGEDKETEDCTNE